MQAVLDRWTNPMGMTFNMAPQVTCHHAVIKTIGDSLDSSSADNIGVLLSDDILNMRIFQY